MVNRKVMKNKEGTRKNTENEQQRLEKKRNLGGRGDIRNKGEISQRNKNEQTNKKEKTIHSKYSNFSNGQSSFFFFCTDNNPQSKAARI